MERNKNIEAIRGIAILMMLFYHYTRIIKGIIQTPFGSIVDEAICQTALISFFVISGFGTFLSLEFKINRGEAIGVVDYIRKRAASIMPQYYFCIGVILLTTGTGYLTVANFKAILAYILYVQNIFPSVSGDINGVTWTIAVMMQFYLIAVPLYKLVKRFGLKTYLIVIVFSQISKRILCFIITKHGYPDIYYVIACIRQIFTTVDLFTIGMCSAMFYLKIRDIGKKAPVIKCIVICLIAFVIIEAGFVIDIYKVGSMYGNGFKYLIWEPTIGILLAIILFYFIQVPCKFNSYLGKSIQFVAHNEYGIYLWHMVLILNLSSQSGIYNFLQDKSPIILLFLMMLLACGVGFISTTLTNSEKYKAFFIRKS